jgi:hypothetical protein
MVFRPSINPPSAFEPASFALAPKFPAVRFTSRAEFQSFLAEEQGFLEARATYESAKASREPAISQPGTCAPCLRVARFTSTLAGGERLKDGRYLPDWREAMQCDCRERLNSRQRALLHFVQAAGILPWSRLLLLGPRGAADARLASMVQEIIALRPDAAMPEIDPVHMVVTADYLHLIPALDATLAALQARLVDGGRLIFTVPFDPEAPSSIPQPTESPGGQRLGWDLLERLRAAGFRDAAAYFYWSEEFGYLGATNFIFRAVK